MKKQEELIQAATIARVTNKAGKFLGFLVKSDRTNEYYEVTCLKINGVCEFFCNCIGFKTHGHCKHCTACKELCAARKELQKAAQYTAEMQRDAAIAAEVETIPNIDSSFMDSLFPKAKSSAVKRAHQFTHMEVLYTMPLTSNTNFSILKPAW